MLERVPFEKADWQPHEKSMKLRSIANHVAGLMGWIPIMFNTTGVDIRKPNLPTGKADNSNDLLSDFDRHLAEAIQTLDKASEEELREPWTLYNGDTPIFTLPRVAALRTLVISHMIHHRGQLSVFLRLLDVPVPGMYGPSADDMRF
jgi:uncharacterized damage-inducible protein DinB